MTDQLPPNPLADTDPRSLNDLFNLDPENLTDADVDKIVLELRAQRQRWATEDAAKPARKKAAAKAPAAPPPNQEEIKGLTLDDLGLSL